MVFSKGVRVGLMEKVTFNQRLEGGEGIIQILRGREFQAEGRAAAKALAEDCMACLGNSQEWPRWGDKGEQKRRPERESGRPGHLDIVGY